MATPSARTKLTTRMNFSLKRTFVLIQTIHEPDRPRIRKICLLEFIWIGHSSIPIVFKDILLGLITGKFDILPCIISKKNDLYILISRIKSVNRIRWRLNQ